MNPLSRPSRRSPWWIAGALVFSLVVNAIGIGLVMNLNRPATPKKERGAVVVDEIVLRPQKKHARKRPPQRRNDKPITQKNTAAPPKLPSAIQARSFLKNADMADLIRPMFSAAESADVDLVMSEEMVDTPPKYLKGRSPVYPQSAADRGIEGSVEFLLMVNTEGRVVKVKLRQDSSSGVFEQSARQAVVTWRFSPARWQGEPVSVWVRQTVHFKLNEGIF